MLCELKEGNMALIKCPDCGKEISDTAPACIGCGCLMKPKAAVNTINKRKGGKYELIGFLLMLASIGGVVARIYRPDNDNLLLLARASIILFIIGFIIYLIGRFK